MPTRFLRHSVALLLLLIPVTCAPAQRAERRTASAVIVLRAARLLDVKSGRLIGNPVVVIEGERIKAVGEKLGEAITINEPQEWQPFSQYANMRSNSSFNTVLKEDEAKPSTTEVEFKKIKLRFEVSVVFALK